MSLAHDRLTNIAEISGELVFDTALHVGTGRGSMTTDAQVIRGPDGAPFIPGSSLKGALRSAVERLAHVVGADPCYLEDDDEHSCRLSDEERPNKSLATLETKLCAVCKLFGSPDYGGRLAIADARLVGVWVGEPDVRDGVGINRDTLNAQTGIKFDHEAVPADTRFRFHLRAENLSDDDWKLLALGVLQLVRGDITIGGRRARGLGRCRLEEKTLELRSHSVEGLEGVLKLLGGDEDQETVKRNSAATEFLKGKLQATPQGGE